MRFLKPLRAGQERFSHRGHIYSSVDLTVFPFKPQGDPELARMLCERTMEENVRTWRALADGSVIYGADIIELADVTGEIEIVGRFPSFAAARESVVEGRV